MEVKICRLHLKKPNRCLTTLNSQLEIFDFFFFSFLQSLLSDICKEFYIVINENKPLWCLEVSVYLIWYGFQFRWLFQSGNWVKSSLPNGKGKRNVNSRTSEFFSEEKFPWRYGPSLVYTHAWVSSKVKRIDYIKGQVPPFLSTRSSCKVSTLEMISVSRDFPKEFSVDGFGDWIVRTLLCMSGIGEDHSSIKLWFTWGSNYVF